MKKTLICAGVLVALGSSAHAVTFTGVVPTDFASTDAVVVFDGNDVGLPVQAPLGTISGWDVENFHFLLDRDAKTLSVGFNFYGICGDVDGNGWDGIPSPWLTQNSGIDFANLGYTESVCIAFDFDQDGNFDLIAGDGPFGAGYAVTQFNPAFLPFGLNACFGAALPAHDGGYFHNPVAATPDFELALANLDAFENLNADVICMNYSVYCGSSQDDGVGEDLASGTLCFERELVEAQQQPVSAELVRAYPNPFNPVTTLDVNLAETGPVTLAVYNVNGQKVRTLVDGSLSAGSHRVVFDAAGLPSGLYLAHLQTSAGEQVTRLVLAR